MYLGIRTLLGLSVLLSLIETGVLFFQCSLMDKEKKGYFRYWALGTGLNFLGNVVSYMFFSEQFCKTTLIFSDLFIYFGLIYIYKGTYRFFEKGKFSNRNYVIFGVVLSLIIFLDALSAEFSICKYNTIIKSIVVTVLTFQSVRVILKSKKDFKLESSNYLAMVFFSYTAFFAYRATAYIGIDTFEQMGSNPVELLTYIFVNVAGILLTFGFIIIVNNKLNLENIESKENLNVAFNASPNAVIISTFEGEILLVNEGAGELLKYGQEELIGRSVHDFNFWEDKERREIFVRELKGKGTCKNLELSFLRKGGSRFYGMISSGIVVYKGKKAIISVLVDIEKRKLAEAKLKENEAFLEGIIENSDLVIFVKDTDGRYRFVNKKWEEITGVIRQFVYGKKDDEIFSKGIAENFQGLDKLVIESGEVKKREEILKEGDKIRYFLSTKFPLKNIKGEVTGLCGMSMEITNRKENEQKIKELVNQLQIEKEYVERYVILDGLTRIYNRRYFNEAIRREFYRIKRTKSDLSLIILDIDYFKKYNDTYGHLQGDECLKKVALSIKEALHRNTDVLARYGGEEFAVILPDTGMEGALEVAERIRKEVENLKIPHKASDINESITISVGVTTASKEKLVSIEKLVNFADNALYSAKKKGRNRVEAYHESPKEEDKVRFIQLIWNPDDESGNTIIDKEHKRLLEISNEIITALMNRYEKSTCLIIINELLEEITKHFEDEENIMEEIGYPRLAEHRSAHKILKKKAMEFKVKFEESEEYEEVFREVINFMIYDLIAQHLVEKDKDYFPYINRQKGNRI